MGSTMLKKAVEGQTNDDGTTVVLGTEGEGGGGQGAEGNLEGRGNQTEGQGAESEGAGDEVVVTIGEESPASQEEEVVKAPEWVRELRKSGREKDRKIRELEDKLKATTGAETKPAPLGKKPTLEEHDYDTDKYEAALTDWYERKRKADEEATRVEAEQKEAQKAWQAKLDAYGKAKTELKVKDFDDAEATAQEIFSVTQQGIILQGAENPALLIYALGKNPKKLKELASINDPVKFTFAVAKLETQLKVTNHKAVPPPEKTVRGTGPVSGTVDSQLERLRADAEKTGDYSKVLAYRRQKRNAG
jgi:hypothetical protein